MSYWWVRYEESEGFNLSWHGPYDEVGRAEREAKRLSQTHDAMDKFAELIHGLAGGKGMRMTEFFNGQEFPRGGSGWHGYTPPEEIDIP